jgi:hypothetical protein
VGAALAANNAAKAAPTTIQILSFLVLYRHLLNNHNIRFADRIFIFRLLKINYFTVGFMHGGQDFGGFFLGQVRKRGVRSCHFNFLISFDPPKDNYCIYNDESQKFVTITIELQL